MSDSVHQMGFSKSHASVNKERIVDLSRGFGHGQGCGVGQIVIGTDYKGIEGVLRV